MSVSLSKGASLDLTKAAADQGLTLENVTVAAGWDTKEDIDLLATYLDESGNAIPDENGNGTNIDEALTSFLNAKGNKDNNPPVKGAQHNGDNRDGAGDGDDETIDFKLSEVPANVKEIALAVMSYGTDGTDGKPLGDVKGTFARVLNDGTELGKYELTDNYPTVKSVEFGRLVRTGSGWEFKTTGKEVAGNDFRTVLQSYGVTGL